MNNERVLKVADAIEAQPDKFDMGSYFADEFGDTVAVSEVTKTFRRDLKCGTTACVAGWTLVLFGSRLKNRMDTYLSYSQAAAELLELDSETADRLFFWTGDHSDLANVTAQEMAFRMREMVRKRSCDNEGGKR